MAVCKAVLASARSSSAGRLCASWVIAIEFSPAFDDAVGSATAVVPARISVPCSFCVCSEGISWADGAVWTTSEPCGEDFSQR
jgi:hypothetical protein